MRKSKRNALILATAAVSGIAQFGYAANVTWQASPASSFWNAANWNTAGNPVTPVPGTDALFFGVSNTTNLNNDFPDPSQFNGITFNAGASAFTLNGAAVTLAGNVVNSSS